jgi:hypothetical protein
MGSLIVQGMVGVALPALLTLILAGLVLKVPAFGENLKWPLIGLIVVGCFVLSYCVLFGGVVFPPREATHWLPYTAIGALLFGILLLITRGVVQIIARLIAAFAVAWTILQSQISSGRSLLISLAWLTAVTLILFATPRLIERWGASRSTTAEVLLGMALAAGFGGIALSLGGSAVLGQICGAFGLVLASLTFLSYLMPTVRPGRILPLIYVFVFGGLLLNGSLYADLPWVTSGLLWIAPFGVLVGAPAAFAGRNWSGRLLVRGLIVLVVAALALAALFLIAPPGNEY